MTTDLGTSSVTHAVIPAPLAVEPAEGAPVPLADVVVVAPDERLAALAAELLVPAGVTVVGAVTAVPEAGTLAGPTTLTLTLDPASGPAGSGHPERYTLRAADGVVVVTAPERVGLLHGVRTLVRLVEGPAQDAAPVVRPVVVHDEPRYGWRGLSLDVVRHFFGPADLRAVVDLVASYKMNRLHLHLSDDQGWRLQIPSRPELVARSSQAAVDGAPGGYLTVEEFRSLQAYAAERFVTVIPEIDVPGHVNAATHAYGELMPDGVPTDAYEGIEVGFSRLHLDLPATEPFLRDVLTDVARMTDGPWVHFGADEVLHMEGAEYAGFIKLCQEIITAAGKIPVGWQEAGGAQTGSHDHAAAPEPEPAEPEEMRVLPGTVLQYWDTRPDTAVFVRAAEAGARFVLSPATSCYLDMKYAPGHELGIEWAGFVELRDSYDWEPAEVIPGLPEAALEGVSACVWTETLATRDQLFSMLLPRLPAVAEAGWSVPAAKDWGSFRSRVATEAAAWRRDGLAYHPTPQVDW